MTPYHNDRLNKTDKEFILIWSLILAVCLGIWLLVMGFFLPPSAEAEPIEVFDMLILDPEIVTPTNITSWNPDTQQIESPIFYTPFTEYINNRPITYIPQAVFAQQGETLDDLPTYALAKFHWWLFGFVFLPEGQRQYADCVGGIKFAQELMDDTPLVDQPGHPAYEFVKAVRQYQVPFDAIQNFFDVSLPPTLEDGIAHAKAALATLDNTVFHVHACLQTRYDWKRRVQLRVNEVCFKYSDALQEAGYSANQAAALRKSLEACRVIAIQQ